MVATGEFSSLEEAKRLFLEILGAVAQYQVKKVLLDGRTLKGKPEVFERFLYGEFAAKETIRFVTAHGLAPRFAYVMHAPIRDPERFGENVMVNRGMNVKSFENLLLRWAEEHQRRDGSYPYPSSVTVTVTSMPRNDEAEPTKVPHNGRTCFESHATATRMRLRLPMMLLVGSKSIQPAPGK